jgi:murein DD-endopeptidase MepM/ murein hydrolase activator NlpD
MSCRRNSISKSKPAFREISLRFVFCLIVLAACTPVKGESTRIFPTTTGTKSVEQNPTLVTTPTSTTDGNQEGTAYPDIPPFRISSTSTLTATNPTECSPDLCAYSGQYFLDRPIAQPGNDVVDGTYPFGSTQSGKRDPHHGVEFLNGSGTPVLAAADGVVVVAGDDREPTSAHGVWPITFYGPYSYFYGNLVVIQHQTPPGLLLPFSELPQLIYTLYGHLSQISVQVGQQVVAGQEIGKVGMTGIAEGSHLHFEVRLGENTYKASRNPELWLKPHTDKQGRLKGGIAGRVIDSYNVNLELSSIVIEQMKEGTCLLYTSPSPRDGLLSRMPSSA